MNFGKWIAAGAAVMMGLAAPAMAQTPLTIMVFQGMQNLPLFAAQSQGFFERNGLKVDIKIAPSSDELRNGLAEGRWQIVHGAIDNSVAMVEVAKADAVIFMGGDNGFNSVIVQGDINAIEDLRGKTVAVDATNTAYAFLLYEILRQKGLKRGTDYDVKAAGASFRRYEAMVQDKSLKAAVLNPPFSLRAVQAGLKDFGLAVKAVGAYQATGGFVMRNWAQANSDTVVRYVRAYVEGLRWAIDPANRDAATKLLADGLKLPPELAARCYEIAADPATGLAKDARFDMNGFNNVLRLRAEFEGGMPPAPEKYLDLSYYQRALTGM
ncbi:MAG TPA: ABC transporter substrate-binding protein [Xanthobacteraceae bacterium]|nr:ABC transporter substrate-binding protein [Xanthobacteraceae bacterium]